MLLCNHDDHNIITTALDTLQQLLNSPVDHVIQRLTCPVGIQNSLDADKWEVKVNENGPLSSSNLKFLSIHYFATQEREYNSTSRLASLYKMYSYFLFLDLTISCHIFRSL